MGGPDELEVTFAPLRTFIRWFSQWGTTESLSEGAPTRIHAKCLSELGKLVFVTGAVQLGQPAFARALYPDNYAK